MIAAFYCDGEEPIKRDPRTILGSLLRQLVLSNILPSEALRIIHAVYEYHQNDNYRTARSRDKARQLAIEFAAALEKVSERLPRFRNKLPVIPVRM